MDASAIFGLEMVCIPVDPLKVNTVLPDLPFLVVMRTTPFDARVPKIAAADASFRTSIRSISSGFKKLRFVPGGRGTLSTTYRGSEPLTDVIPRIITRGLAPGPPEPVI